MTYRLASTGFVIERAKGRALAIETKHEMIGGRERASLDVNGENGQGIPGHRRASLSMARSDNRT